MALLFDACSTLISLIFLGIVGLVAGAAISFIPHRPPRPEKSEGGVSFRLQSELEPKGDQPQAIEKLVDGARHGLAKQTLLGVTGSGKTFTMANIVNTLQRPTLILAHNKTLAAQLCNEFREFLTFYPTNRRADYAQYKLGLCHFRQMAKPERDQTQTNDAIAEFRKANARRFRGFEAPEMNIQCIEDAVNLPIDEALPELLARLAERGSAVLHAPPGAGKTLTVARLATRLRSLWEITAPLLRTGVIAGGVTQINIMIGTVIAHRQPAVGGGVIVNAGKPSDQDASLASARRQHLHVDQL